MSNDYHDYAPPKAEDKVDENDFWRNDVHDNTYTTSENNINNGDSLNNNNNNTNNDLHNVNDYWKTNSSNNVANNCDNVNNTNNTSMNQNHVSSNYVTSNYNNGDYNQYNSYNNVSNGWNGYHSQYDYPVVPDHYNDAGTMYGYVPDVCQNQQHGYYPYLNDALYYHREHPQANTVLILAVVSLFFHPVAFIGWYLGAKYKRDIEKGAPYEYSGVLRIGHILSMIFSIMGIVFGSFMLFLIFLGLN